MMRPVVWEPLYARNWPVILGYSEKGNASDQESGSVTTNALATADPFHMDEVGISDKWSENSVLST